MTSKNINGPLSPATLVPGINLAFNTASARRVTVGQQQAVCLVGQRLAAGATAAGVLTQIFSDSQARTAFGPGSVLHMMSRAALTATPQGAALNLYCIATDDAPGATAATATITISGPATGAGAVTVTLAANEPLVLGVDSGNTAAAIATALAAAINARPDWPVTAVAAAAVVTLTAKNKGTCGNQLRLVASSSAPGTGAVPTAFAGGTIDPAITATLATIYTAGHTLVVLGQNDTPALQALRAHLDAVNGPVEQRDCIGVYGSTATLATVTTQAATVNSMFMTCGWHRNSTSAPCEVAAAYAAVIAGEADPARPLNELELVGIAPADARDWPMRSEQQSALYNGVTPLLSGADGRTAIVRAVTTYTTDSTGQRDNSVVDLTTPRTLAVVRGAIRTAIKRDFPRAKLTDKKLPALRSTVLGALQALEGAEVIENVNALAPQVLVERDAQNRSMVQISVPADVVNGLHNVNGIINLTL